MAFLSFCQILFAKQFNMVQKGMWDIQFFVMSVSQLLLLLAMVASSMLGAVVASTFKISG